MSDIIESQSHVLEIIEASMCYETSGPLPIDAEISKVQLDPGILDALRISCDLVGAEFASGRVSPSSINLRQVSAVGITVAIFEGETLLVDWNAFAIEDHDDPPWTNTTSHLSTARRNRIQELLQPHFRPLSEQTRFNHSIWDCTASLRDLSNHQRLSLEALARG